MFAEWDCIFRKLRVGGDGRDKPDKPGHDGLESQSFRRLVSYAFPALLGERFRAPGIGFYPLAAGTKPLQPVRKLLAVTATSTLIAQFGAALPTRLL